jgi:hypothetical protein
MKLGLGISALGILTLLSTAGCGRHAEASRSPASEGPAQRSAGYGASVDKIGEAAPASPAAGMSPESRSLESNARSYAPKDEERSRPGLGTSWGEAVSSRVSTTSFMREDDDSPDATASFFYNDEHGVSAMTRGRFVDWNESVRSIAPGVTVSITDASGRALPAARVDGRVYAVGRDGDRYLIHIDNRSGARVEAVATVDGLDVIDGEEGSLEKRGYVIAPYGSLDIEGFRESEGSVRAFRFGSTNDSYASRRGKGRNVGVIGIALFRERGTGGRWTAEEVQRRETADPFPNRFAPPPPPVGYRAY